MTEKEFEKLATENCNELSKNYCEFKTFWKAGFNTAMQLVNAKLKLLNDLLDSIEVEPSKLTNPDDILEEVYIRG